MTIDAVTTSQIDLTNIAAHAWLVALWLTAGALCACVLSSGSSLVTIRRLDPKPSGA